MDIGKNKSLLYQKVVNEIYKLIDENEIKPGEKFPTEKQLVSKWGVSQNVLREAFRVLESRGVIISHQGKGRFLREIPINPQQHNSGYGYISKDIERYSLLEILDLRKLLEMKAMELIVLNASSEDIDDIEKEFNRMKKKFIKHNHTEGEILLHRLYVSKSGNLFLQKISNIVFDATIEFMHNNFIEVYSAHNPERAIKEHEQIIIALKNREVVKAKEMMKIHLQATIDML